MFKLLRSFIKSSKYYIKYRFDVNFIDQAFQEILRNWLVWRKRVQLNSNHLKVSNSDKKSRRDENLEMILGSHLIKYE